MISYLTRYNLIDEKFYKKFQPENMSSFNYSHFATIANNNESETILKGKKYYKLTQREMYFFYFDSKIQSTIYLKE